MGSDSFSLPILDALVKGGTRLPTPVTVVGVVTQPDRAAGRGRRLSRNVVTTRALVADILVLQPERLRDVSAIDSILRLHPDVVVVAAYGQFLPNALLTVPSAGCLNLHPSLLPRFRGPSPVPATILQGELVTGTTLMKMSTKMDAGPIVLQSVTEVGREETTGELEARLANLGADLLLRALPAWLNGSLAVLAQNESLATYTSLVKKIDARLDWSSPAEILARQVRAYNPWPVAFTAWQGRALRILRAHPESGNGERGRVHGLRGADLLVACGEGLLVVEELQLAGGKALPPSEVVRGYPALVSASFV